MSLTEHQRRALPVIRARFSQALVPSGIAESVEDRARQPNPAHFPPNVTVRIEIALPSPDLHPLLRDRCALRTPASEHVPIYFYALQGDNDQVETGVADTHVLFFIHGGANILGHPTEPTFVQFYVQLLRDLAAHAGDARKCVLIAPSYRLASVPENAFPAALQDLVAAYDYILGKGYTPSNIVVAGDSAGGSHAVVLTHLVLQSDRPQPRGVISIAPVSILSLDPLSEAAKAQASGDIIDPSKHELLVRTYLGDSGVAPSDPLVSCAFIPFSTSWPETLILVGTADGLTEGARELARRLKKTKRLVELVEYDERPHGWWVLPQIFPEDVKDTSQRIANFVFNEHESLIGR